MSKVKAKLDVPSNIKCNCGHTKKDHHKGGWCHSSSHPRAGECGCTFYAPNDRWILNNPPERRMLKKLAEGLKTLEEKEFRYAAYISENKGECGTVCCAIGWAPRFIPESKIVWVKSPLRENNLNLVLNDVNIDVLELKKVFKLNDIAIEYMFYGRETLQPLYSKSNFGLSLAEVIQRILFIHRNYKKYKL